LINRSNEDYIEKCNTLQPIGNSDHGIVLVDISVNINKAKPAERKYTSGRKQT